MSFNYAELSRFIGYVAGILVGLGFVVYGLVNGDLPTALAGATALGVSVTAAPNTNKSNAQVLDLSEVSVMPVGEEDAEPQVGKHRDDEV